MTIIISFLSIQPPLPQEEIQLIAVADILILTFENMTKSSCVQKEVESQEV